MLTTQKVEAGIEMLELVVLKNRHMARASGKPQPNLPSVCLRLRQLTIISVPCEPIMLQFWSVHLPKLKLNVDLKTLTEF